MCKSLEDHRLNIEQLRTLYQCLIEKIQDISLVSNVDREDVQKYNDLKRQVNLLESKLINQ